MSKKARKKKAAASAPGLRRVVIENVRPRVDGVPYWLRGGVIGLMLGGIVCALMFAVYPARDNLFIIWPMYLFCLGGLECFSNLMSFVASLFIHAAAYFEAGAVIGLLKERKRSSI